MKIREKAKLVLMSSALFLSVTFPLHSHAKKVEERPGAIAMAADAVLMRPLMFLATLGGTGFYVLTLPFSFLGGNAEEAGQKLVVTPFKSTFVRCLGCTRKHLDDREEYY